MASPSKSLPRVVVHERPMVASCAALAAGCEAAGYAVVWQRPGVWTLDSLVPDAVMAVVHGLHGNGERIRAAYHARGIPVWIVDCPRLREEPEAVGLFSESLAWLPAVGSTREPIAAPVLTDRVEEVVLVAGQKPNDMAHGMDVTAIGRWARAAIRSAHEQTTLPVVYRPHPLDTLTAMPEDAFGADAVSDVTTSLHGELARSAVVVTYNSTVGWDAIAAGVPVYATAPAERVSYREYVTTSLRAPVPLGEAQRDDALSRSAATQWTMTELRDGTAVRAIMAKPVVVDAPKRRAKRSKVAA